jgi:hypothetical protein
MLKSKLLGHLQEVSGTSTSFFFDWLKSMPALYIPPILMSDITNSFYVKTPVETGALYHESPPHDKFYQS